VQRKLGPKAISIFATGCCGDINHSDPRATTRNKTDFIGNSLGTTITDNLPKLSPVSTDGRLDVRHAVVNLPLQECGPDDVKASIEVLKAVEAGKTVDFFDHVVLVHPADVERVDPLEGAKASRSYLESA